MMIARFLKWTVAVAVLAGAGVAGYATRDRWLPLFYSVKPAESAESASGEPTAPTGRIIVNEQAQANLGLSAKPLAARTYWKTIPVPGMVVDRPGQSDRNIVAPAIGVVAEINHVPGDTVQPSEPLFTVKLLSESLHQTQTEFYMNAQDIVLAEAKRKRLTAAGGAIPAGQIIEIENQITRYQIAVKAYRQELLNRGFRPDAIDGIADGRFVNEVTVTAPARSIALPKPPDTTTASKSGLAGSPVTFEVQELKVELGQQVQAGQTLCLLADHHMLTIEGRAFRDETPLLERSVKERWPVVVDFQEDAASGWGELQQSFRIRYLASTIDPATRTFAFYLPLENESRAIEDDGRTQTLWRFRPGQKVRLAVRVEEMKNVFVLPADAVTRDGTDAYVFTQNVNTFTRKPVRILLQDRERVVVANDGSLPPGTYVVQSAAAQLNRMVKAGGATGVPKGYHIHADGSLHKNEDEGK